MESLQKGRFSIRAFLVAFACISGAVAGSILLYRDFNGGGSASLGAPVATLEKREAKVRRKPATSYIWQHIAEKSPLFLKESVQTGPDSTAVVRLQDGSLLELGENSLVVIDRTAELSLNFLKGSMILRQTGGDKQITSEGAGKATIRELDVRLMHPEALAHFFTDESSTSDIAFEWTSKSGALSFVEISPDRTFRSSRVRRLKPESGSAVLVKGLSPGQHFWRVVGENGEPSQIRPFKISLAEALVPVWPARTERIRSFGEKSPVQFRWKPARLSTSDSIKHEIEIARDREFQSILSRQPITPDSGVAAVSGLPSGQYHWRTRSQFGKIEKHSATETFVIEHIDHVALKLLGPARDAILGIQPDLRFIWAGGDNPDLSYLWEVQDQDGLPVVNAKGNATAALWKSVRSGLFRWRVAAVWNGRTVGTTEWSRLTVSQGEPLTLVSPENAQDFLYWQKVPEFSFQWKEDPLIAQGYSYDFQIATDRDFRNLVASKRTASPSVPGSEVTNATGLFYWRVRVLDSTGRPVKTSDVRSLRTGLHPLLAAPTVHPGTKTFNLRDDGAIPVLQWTRIEAARGYEVTFIPQGPEGRQPASNKPLVTLTKETSLAVPELPEGRYAWKVRAIDVLERKGNASATGVVEITYGTPLPAPKILSSEVQ